MILDSAWSVIALNFLLCLFDQFYGIVTLSEILNLDGSVVAWVVRHFYFVNLFSFMELLHSSLSWFWLVSCSNEWSEFWFSEILFWLVNCSGLSWFWLVSCSIKHLNILYSLFDQFYGIVTQFWLVNYSTDFWFWLVSCSNECFYFVYSVSFKELLHGCLILRESDWLLVALILISQF